jgi:hypothetical protein
MVRSFPSVEFIFNGASGGKRISIGLAFQASAPGEEIFERKLRDECYKGFRARCRNANADGAPNEQLAWRLAKVAPLLLL